MTEFYLSLILPAHNEELRLPSTLEKVKAYLSARSFSSEIIIVENASVDNTGRIAETFALGTPNCKVLHDPIPGKGRAVKKGMLAASGKYRFVCDVDLSMPVEGIDSFLPPALEGYDIAIASREAPGASRIGEPTYRHLVGRVFNTLVRWLTLPGLQDTQCGFKCFTAEAAQTLFPLAKLEGWTFDVEVLAIALHNHYRVTEVPIQWTYFGHSKVHVLRDSLHMAMDLLKIRQNLRRGDYDLPL